MYILFSLIIVHPVNHFCKPSRYFDIRIVSSVNRLLLIGRLFPLISVLSSSSAFWIISSEYTLTEMTDLWHWTEWETGHSPVWHFSESAFLLKKCCSLLRYFPIMIILEGDYVWPYQRLRCSPENTRSRLIDWYTHLCTSTFRVSLVPNAFINPNCRQCFTQLWYVFCRV